MKSKNIWITVVIAIITSLLSNIDRLSDVVNGGKVIIKEETEYTDTSGVVHKTYIEMNSDCRNREKDYKERILETDKKISDITNKMLVLAREKVKLQREKDSIKKACDSMPKITIVNKPIRVDTIYREKEEKVDSAIMSTKDSIEEKIKRKKFLGIF